MNKHRCPNCGKLLIDPMGNPASPYLLVGEFPGYKETVQGLPFAFSDRVQPLGGDILQAELMRVGIMMNDVLVTNLWQHQKPVKLSASGKKNKTISGQYDKEACPLEWHLNQLVNLFKDRTHVLLMGSEVTKALLEVPYTEVTGTRVKVPGLGRTKTHFWVGPNPSLAYNQPVGEMRLAFERFAGDIGKKTK